MHHGCFSLCCYVVEPVFSVLTEDTDDKNHRVWSGIKNFRWRRQTRRLLKYVRPCTIQLCKKFNRCFGLVIVVAELWFLGLVAGGKAVRESGWCFTFSDNNQTFPSMNSKIPTWQICLFAGSAVSLHSFLQFSKICNKYDGLPSASLWHFS